MKREISGRGSPILYGRMSKIIGGCAILTLVLTIIMEYVATAAMKILGTSPMLIQATAHIFVLLQLFLGIIAILSLLFTVLMPVKMKLLDLVRFRLFDPKNGNPLGLMVDQKYPKTRIRVLRRDGLIWYVLIRIEANNVDIEKLTKVSNLISSAFVGRYHGFAVVKTDVDNGGNFVEFRLKNIAAPHKFTYKSVSSLKPRNSTKLKIQDGISLDLRYSGSMLFAAKTRSGKTTAVISMLIQLAMLGPDEHGSKILIVDPKRAELSRLPTVLSPTVDGDEMDAHNIIDAIKEFRNLMIARQGYLNEQSELKGDAVHWWDANMKPSVLFIDEFAALRTLLPSRTNKDDSEYSLPAFEKLLTQIMTMGSSAGCFVIVSIAQAGADQISTMLRNAFMTKILLRPTLEEARFLWSSGQLINFTEQDYKAGDAIMTVADGTHESNVVYVQFPKMEFPVYRELGRLLKAYERPK